MSDEVEEKLYGLLDVAEQQQNAAQMALGGLEAERLALAKYFKQWTAGIAPLGEEMRAALLQAVPTGMAGAAEAGVEAVKDATVPLLTLLDDMSVQSKQAENSLRTIGQRASWTALAWGFAATAGLAILWWSASCAVLWLDTNAIGRMEVQRAQLEIEIADLKESRAAWGKAGLLGKLQRCGPKQRLCIQVDESAGSYGERKDYRVLYDHQ